MSKSLAVALPSRRPSPALLGLALALALLATLAPTRAAIVGATTDDEAAAEAKVFSLLSKDRTELGLVPYRRDPRLQELARQRSAEQAAAGEMTHELPEGGMVWDRFDEAGVTWYAAGEVIARNLTDDPITSAALAYWSWKNSPGHRAILQADDLNYIGIGVATDPSTGRRYFTAIVVRGPDRSGAVGRISSVSRTDRTATKGEVAVRWRGADLRLQVLTAGLKDFQVQRRRAGGDWVTIRTGTTSTRLSQWLTRGVRYEFRVRARDKKGTYGSWSTPLAVTP